MKKRPNNISLLVDDEHSASKKMAELFEYKSVLLKKIQEEVGSNNLMDLVFYLAENYHPEFAIPKKQGRKRVWSKELEVMLAIHADMYKKAGKKRSIDASLEYILESTMWGVFVRRSSSKAYSNGGLTALKEHYWNGKRSSSYDDEFDLMMKDTIGWSRKLKRMLSK